MINVDIKIDIRLPDIIDICPRCFGSGKLKVMQSAMTHEGIAVRVADTTVKCDLCKGNGFLKERNDRTKK